MLNSVRTAEFTLQVTKPSFEPTGMFEITFLECIRIEQALFKFISGCLCGERITFHCESTVVKRRKVLYSRCCVCFLASETKVSRRLKLTCHDTACRYSNTPLTKCAWNANRNAVTYRCLPYHFSRTTLIKIQRQSRVPGPGQWDLGGGGAIRHQLSLSVPAQCHCQWRVWMFTKWSKIETHNLESCIMHRCQHYRRTLSGVNSRFFSVIPLFT